MLCTEFDIHSIAMNPEDANDCTAKRVQLFVDVSYKHITEGSCLLSLNCQPLSKSESTDNSGHVGDLSDSSYNESLARGAVPRTAEMLMVSHNIDYNRVKALKKKWSNSTLIYAVLDAVDRLSSSTADVGSFLESSPSLPILQKKPKHTDTFDSLLRHSSYFDKHNRHKKRTRLTLNELSSVGAQPPTAAGTSDIIASARTRPSATITSGAYEEVMLPLVGPSEFVETATDFETFSSQMSIPQSGLMTRHTLKKKLSQKILPLPEHNQFVIKKKEKYVSQDLIKLSKIVGLLVFCRSLHNDNYYIAKIVAILNTLFVEVELCNNVKQTMEITSLIFDLNVLVGQEVMFKNVYNSDPNWYVGIVSSIFSDENLKFSVMSNEGDHEITSSNICFTNDQAQIIINNYTPPEIICDDISDVLPAGLEVEQFCEEIILQ
ncbi:hypothetical protein FQA39_LY15484 [Lamprigera yunnana]|nr:hypothetical protein FQA39_LY15484 [Lamprigera yunnana]